MRYRGHTQTLEPGEPRLKADFVTFYDLGKLSNLSKAQFLFL